MHPVESYLGELHQIHASGQGTAETSGYPALHDLLKEAGKGLKPQVVPLSQLKDQGAGLPDFGLFTKEQHRKMGADTPLSSNILPARGVVEVKGVKDNTWLTSKGAQATKYWEKYRLVLVTNYRDFLILGQDAEGKPLHLGTYRIAKDEAEFWALARHPERAAALQGEALMDFLRRALMQAAPLRDPQDLAALLATYAREAKHRVDTHAHLPALDHLRKALEQALGLQFEGEQGDRFFHSNLVQTLFYGIFSAWVSWCEGAQIDERFQWRQATWTLRVPMVRALFDQLAVPDKLEPLGLVEVLNWAEDALNRVDRPAFFKTFQTDQAIQYFYEPFLEAFDPELRKELGVWYTPREIVRYMVARVDHVLREELGRPEGLADPAVHVLDPCCGTGAFLVEVARKIHENLEAAGKGALSGALLKEALQKRVHGFELLPAPFVVAHLQMGLLLQQLGGTLGKDERLPIYLTNALTGWEPPTGPKAAFLMPELEAEKEAADHVKRDTPILVILGNPPYSGYPGIAHIDEERSLSTAYREPVKVKKPEGHGLNDLYVRFFRMAERKITEWTKEGIVCFISNGSWLDGLSHTAMREAFLDRFDRIWVDSLNGDKYRTGKLTPEGEPDPSVFSTPQNREGIQVGTAIALMLRKNGHEAISHLDYRELWGKGKLAQLSEEAQGDAPAYGVQISPELALGLPFRPLNAGADYLGWPTLPEVFPVFFPGVKTSRDSFLVDIDKERLEGRLAHYFDSSRSHSQVEEAYPEIMAASDRFNPDGIRDHLVKRGYKPEGLVRFAYRPMDVRWVYWEKETKLLDEKRPDYFPQVFQGNLCLVTQQTPRRDWAPPQTSGAIGCLDLMDRGASFLPLLFRAHHEEGTLYAADERPNLSAEAMARVTALGAEPTDLFFHALAILHAPAYRVENAGALRQDWPRVPWPTTKSQLEASAALGRRLAALLDVEQPVSGVTLGKIPSVLRDVAVLTTVGGSPLNLPDDLALTAGWGIAGKGGIAMPGKGKREGAQVWLNDHVYWEGIPDDIWKYSLGGYQVLKKWLSYRELRLLGRPLRPEEAEHFANMARRISALLALETDLDANLVRFR